MEASASSPACIDARRNHFDGFLVAVAERIWLKRGAVALGVIVRLILVLVAFVGALSVAKQAHAQSVDCAAATGASAIVCSDPQLSALEEHRGKLVEQLARTDPAAISRDEIWLDGRASCADSDCLTLSYLNHNEALRLLVESVDRDLLPPGAPLTAIEPAVEEPPLAPEPPILPEREDAVEQEPAAAPVEQSFGGLILAAGFAGLAALFMVFGVINDRRAAARDAAQATVREAAARAKQEEERQQRDAEMARAKARVEAQEARLSAIISKTVETAAAGGVLPFAQWMSGQERTLLFAMSAADMTEKLDAAYQGREVVDRLFERGLRHIIVQDIEAAREYVPPGLYNEFYSFVLERLEREEAQRRSRAESAQALRDLEHREFERRSAERDRQFKEQEAQSLVDEIEAETRRLGWARRDGSAVRVRMSETVLARLNARLAALR